MLDTTVRLWTLPGLSWAAETWLEEFSAGADGHGNRNTDVLLPYTQCYIEPRCHTYIHQHYAPTTSCFADWSKHDHDIDHNPML